MVTELPYGSAEMVISKSTEGRRGETETSFIVKNVEGVGTQ